MKPLIYDIEIKKAILGRGETPIPGIEYCEGWKDHANMGISCICAYDYEESRYRVFMEDNLAVFAAMTQERRPIVGFNNIAFDNKVCDLNGITIPESWSYDILAELWAAAGLPRHFSGSSHMGFGLDATCRANFGVGKTGHGALAPVQYQRGEFGALVDYCLTDVHRTKLLMDRIIERGSLIDPRDALVTLEMPRDALITPPAAPAV